MKKAFLGVIREFVNNVNTKSNLSKVDNESKNHDLNVYILSKWWFHWNNNVCYKWWNVSQTLSVSSSKVEDIEDESPKRKETISGNRIIDVNKLSDIFGEMLCPECSS